MSEPAAKLVGSAAGAARGGDHTASSWATRWATPSRRSTRVVGKPTTGRG